MFFYHFFFFFKYSSIFKTGVTHISVYKKKINYFKFFFKTIFKYLNSVQLKRLRKNRFKSQQLTSNVLPYNKVITQKQNFIWTPLFYFFWSNTFRIKCNLSRHIFFFPPYGKVLNKFKRKRRRNLFVRKLIRFF